MNNAELSGEENASCRAQPLWYTMNYNVKCSPKNDHETATGGMPAGLRTPCFEQ